MVKKNNISRKKPSVTITKKYNKLIAKKRPTKKANLSKTKKAFKVLGGDIKSNNIFKYIKSIGFEFETTQLVKLTITQDKETSKKFLVNSALTNNDLEFGYDDPDELIFIVDEKDEKFKITSDTNDDSLFNKELLSIYKELNNKVGGEESDNESERSEAEPEESDDEEDSDNIICENINVQLEIPELGRKGTFDIKFKEDIDSPLNACGTFTDTEFISTFYKPNQTNDIIKYYLFKSVKRIIDHVRQLRTYTRNSLLITNTATNENRTIDIKQAYLLPGTTLIYFNPLQSLDPKFNISEDLLLVTQMTFCCNILYIYRIMIQLLTLVEDEKKKLLDSGHADIFRFIGMDTQDIMDVMKLTNKLFENYQKIQNEEIYKFPLESEDFKYLKLYLFLIFYKLFKYLNEYVCDKSLLKYNLSFAVRHYNYDLFKEAEKYLRKIFSTDFAGKSEEYINQKIMSILSKLLNNKILDRYFFIKDQVCSLRLQLLKNKDDESNFGRPEYSILSYFEYFLTNNSDWLVDNDIDKKSTKFDLANNDIIVEFRDFPKFLLMELYFTGDEQLKNDLDFTFDNISVVSLKQFQMYMDRNGYQFTS